MKDPIEVGLPMMSTRDYFAIHFAAKLVQIIRKNGKDQVICNLGAACDMADALIENLQAPRIVEPPKDSFQVPTIVPPSPT